MNTQILEEVLGSESLPSIPAIAAQVVELTSDPDVSLAQLAELIRQDQALSAKILRTVNSSFYGLRQRCANIQKALGLLGLKPVKSLVLGFSMVQAINSSDDDEFDYQTYWRRSLFGALGARAVAENRSLPFVEEAFLAGLFQDIGVVAMYRALGRAYLDVFNTAGGDHSRLSRLEHETFEVTHADVGALLAEHWRMPSELTLPVKYHESPTAAPSSCSQIVRCVAMGNMVHEVLDAVEPAPHLRRLYEKANSWMAIKNSDIDEIIEKVAASVPEVSRLFSVRVGNQPECGEVLKQAQRRLMSMASQGGLESYAERNLESLIEHQERDGLTGALGREGFLAAIREGVPTALAGDSPITVAQLAFQGLKDLAATHGEPSRDEALIGIVSLLHTSFSQMGGIICRLSESVFGVVIPGANRASTVLAAERFRVEFLSSLPDWVEGLAPDAKPVSVSVGVASLDLDTVEKIKGVDELLKATFEALSSAKKAGGSRVCSFTSAAA